MIEQAKSSPKTRPATTEQKFNERKRLVTAALSILFIGIAVSVGDHLYCRAIKSQVCVEERRDVVSSMSNALSFVSGLLIKSPLQ